jgi:predicted DNA-binding transcriptional regulator AlpA
MKNQVPTHALAPGPNIIPPTKYASTSGPSPNDDDPLLGLAEVLALTRHKKSWLYAMIERGQFPAGYRIGRRRFWRASEVKAAIQKLLIPARDAHEEPDGSVHPRGKQGHLDARS